MVLQPKTKNEMLRNKMRYKENPYERQNSDQWRRQPIPPRKFPQPPRQPFPPKKPFPGFPPGKFPPKKPFPPEKPYPIPGPRPPRPRPPRPNPGDDASVQKCMALCQQRHNKRPPEKQYYFK